MPSKLKLAAVAVVILVAIGIVTSWQAQRKTNSDLTATLATQATQIKQAADREQQRTEQLNAALAKIAAQERQVQTPQQAAAAIPSVLPPLPLPVKIDLPDLSQTPKGSTPAPATISIPQPDLKPLYDSLQDCRACQLERDAAKQNLADEQAQVTALTRERDAAITAARGGSFWVRTKRAAKWFAIGVAAGAALTVAARH
jgi:small-conductance mechanosensitive channel